MSKITEKKLLELGFKKQIVSPEESGTEKGYHFFVLDIDDECVLITTADDETVKGGYVVEFFSFNNICYADSKILDTLVNVLRLGSINGKKKKR